MTSVPGGHPKGFSPPPSLKPHPESDRLQSALIRCDRFVTTFSNTVYRAASVERANKADLISGEGSRLYGGRWNPPGLFRTVYASTHIATANEEALAQNRRNGLPDKEALPLVLCAADLLFEKVLNLNDVEVRKVLRVSLDRMTTEPHGTATESITQAIGRLAFSQSLEGLFVPSTAVRGGVNVVVFPEKLKHQYQFQIYNQEKLPPEIPQLFVKYFMKTCLS